MSKAVKKKKNKIESPDITIERVGWNGETGRLTFLDVHNETDGCAYFLEVTGCHYHGFNKPKK